MSPAQKTTTSLLFTGAQAGKAEEAINFYTSIFPNSSIFYLRKRETDGDGEKAGTVKYAVFTIHGTQYIAMDSHLGHVFSFNPSVSITVTCETEEEIDGLFGKLSEDGSVLMPLSAEYDFSKKFAWVSDRFGVSWQLNLQ